MIIFVFSCHESVVALDGEKDGIIRQSRSDDAEIAWDLESRPHIIMFVVLTEFYRRPRVECGLNRDVFACARIKNVSLQNVRISKRKLLSPVAENAPKSGPKRHGSRNTRVESPAPRSSLGVAKSGLLTGVVEIFPVAVLGFQVRKKTDQVAAPSSLTLT